MRHDPINGEQITVSATHFVRHFSELRRNAERGPVYIENHGKAGWALISADLLSAMVHAPGGRQGSDEAAIQLDALFDTLVARVLLVDADLRLIRAGVAARRHFGIGEHDIGRSLANVPGIDEADTIAKAARRTWASGTAEILEMDAAGAAGRTQRITTTRLPKGICIVIEDLGDPSALRLLDARLSSIESALRALPLSAFGSINARGGICQADASLSSLSGAAGEQLIGTRLGTLFDIATRALVHDLIDQALDYGRAGAGDANLLKDGKDLLPVTVSIAPLDRGSDRAVARFVIVPRTNRATP